MTAVARHRPARPPAQSLSLVFVFSLCGGVLLAFILLPLLRLAASQSASSLARIAALADVRQAITLSLEAALITALLAALLGVPLAYLLARSRFHGRAVVAAIIDLPLAVPHTVAGIALLFVLGRQGIIGAPLAALFGLRFWGTLAGIVAAMLFVSIPYTVNAARIGFEAVDPRLEMTARSLGLGPWQVLRRISLPLAWRSVMTGLTLTYARAVSEFGAVVILVYHPMTAPVKIYELFLRFGVDEAAGMSVLLLLITLGLFILLRALAFGGAAPHGQGR
ncbi:MAG TPA: ABC transporter permease [Stellaceae bacterium]|nr:ABC transporter permease [Stellaceae bacterium]